MGISNRNQGGSMALAPPATTTDTSPVSVRIAPAPRAPESVSDTGLPEPFVADLVLKHLFVQGVCTGFELARRLCVPFSVLEPVLEFLKQEKQVDVTGGQLLGPVSYRFTLTDLGRERARQAMAACQYVGPAPVPMTAYFEQMRQQSVRGMPCTKEAILEALDGLILDDDLIDGLGPAVVSGHSILLFGPPGSGKSAVSQALGRYLNYHGGLIWIPYALYEAGSVITLFDPIVHRRFEEMFPGVSLQATVMSEQGHEPDPRWVCACRPVVVAGGELTLQMLDLSFNATGNFYYPPIQLKANGGLLVIDDFGRQVISPEALLNRWILPLEERFDYLTLANGKKLKIPFEQLIVFSTNLDPNDLADEAFLRRIRYKLPFSAPDRERYEQIFALVADRLGLEVAPDVIEHMFRTYYVGEKKPRGSDPRDLLEIVSSICRFRQLEPLVTVELIDEAARRFFAAEGHPAGC